MGPIVYDEYQIVCRNVNHERYTLRLFDENRNQKSEMHSLRILSIRLGTKNQTKIPIHARILNTSSSECIVSTPTQGVSVNQLPHILESPPVDDDITSMRFEVKSSKSKVYIGDIPLFELLKSKYPIWYNLQAKEGKKEDVIRIKIEVARKAKYELKKTSVKPCLVLDFDCTVSKHHLWGTLNKWHICVQNFLQAFPDETKRPPLDPQDLRFVEFVMGGETRIEMLRKYFEMLRSIGTTIYISTHGSAYDVMPALQCHDMLKYVESVQSYDGVWFRGSMFKSNAEIGIFRAMPKLEWIDFLVSKFEHKPSACWFVDDTLRNYNVGLGLGVLPSSRSSVHCFQDEGFKHNGTGLTAEYLNVMLKSIEEELKEEEEPVSKIKDT